MPEIKNCMEIIVPKEFNVSNVMVHNMENAIRQSKFPMVVDYKKCTSEVTDTTHKLGETPCGTGHNNFLKGILVTFDWRVSKHLMPELERYHWLDIVSSQSTMHRASTLVMRDDTFNEFVLPETIRTVQRLARKYNDSKSEEDFLTLIYNLPSGLELTMGMSTNYLQLKTIYHQRKNHRIPEWRKFCMFIESLPYSNWITE